MKVTDVYSGLGNRPPTRLAGSASFFGACARRCLAPKGYVRTAAVNKEVDCTRTDHVLGALTLLRRG
jgi:hypothetical protein